MRDRTEADDICQGAYNKALLDLILPSIRRAAKDLGYAIAVHGSLLRDIDLIAVGWTEHNVATKEELVDTIVRVIRGITGRCNHYKTESKTWAQKPHGRVATTILVWCGETSANIDLSIVLHKTEE